MELMAPEVTAMVDAGTITADQARKGYMLSLLLVEFLHTEAHRGDVTAMFDNNTREQFIEGLMADTSFAHRFGMFLVNKRGAL